MTRTIGRGDLANAGPAPVRQRATTRSGGGRIDGVAHWLRIAGGGGIVDANEPFAGPHAHRSVRVHPLAGPIRTGPGQLVEIEGRVFGTRVAIAAAG